MFPSGPGAGAGRVQGRDRTVCGPVRTGAGPRPDRRGAGTDRRGAEAEQSVARSGSRLLKLKILCF